MSSLLPTKFPPTVFYPSLIVNLQMRFDEGLTVLNPKSVSGLATNPVVGPPGPTPTEPLVFANAADGGNLSQVLGLVPKTASIELPGYRQAGSFDVTMEFQNLPLDPRVVRALRVEIHLGAVPASDFAAGMEGKINLGRRQSVIQATPDNLVIVGTADSIDTDHNASGSTIHFAGRDLRGILLDTPIDSATLAALHVDRPIDEVIQQLVNDLHPQGKGIQVDIDPTEWPGGRPPSPGDRNNLTRVNLNAQGTRVKAPAKGEASTLKFWDLITQYCFLVGAIPYFVGLRLRIRPAKNLYDAQLMEQSFDPTRRTPFFGGRPRNVDPPFVAASESYSFRRLVFGRDIDSLKFERKLGGTKVPVVKCVSIDTSSNHRGLGKLISGQVPSEQDVARRATSLGTGGSAPQTDVLIIPVPGIKSAAQLELIAGHVREEIGRQEMGGAVTTKNLSSFGGSNQDPDLLNLQPGDPVELRVDASGLGVYPPPIHELTQHEGRSFEEEVKEVTKRLGDQNLARVLVGINRGQIAQLQRIFRVGNVKYDWSAESGVSISFDFQNYLEVRNALQPVGTPPAKVI